MSTIDELGHVTYEKFQPVTQQDIARQSEEMDKRLVDDGLHWQVVGISCTGISRNEYGKPVYDVEIFKGAYGPSVKLSLAFPEGLESDYELLSEMSKLAHQARAIFSQWRSKREQQARDRSIQISLD